MVPAILVLGLPTLLAIQTAKHFITRPHYQTDLRALHAIR